MLDFTLWGSGLSITMGQMKPQGAYVKLCGLNPPAPRPIFPQPLCKETVREILLLYANVSAHTRGDFWNKNVVCLTKHCSLTSNPMK